MKFVTLFKNLANVMLVKDVGQIPFHLKNEFGFESKIVGYKEDLNYPYLNDQVKGLAVEFLERGKSYKYAESSFIDYLRTNSKSIDVLNLYHYHPETFIYGILYKMFNPKGFLYVKLDHDLRSLYAHKVLYHTQNKFAMFFVNFLGSLFRNAIDLVTIETNEGKKLVSEYYPDLENKIALLPNGLDLDQVKKDFDFEKPVTQRENRIITIGRIGMPQKNNEMLMEAATKLDLKDWHIDIVGGYDNEFAQKIEAYFSAHPNLKDKVHFHGNVENRKKVYEMLSTSRVFALTSRWESFGFVIIEAFLTGTYIISTEFASIKDIVPDTTAGMITPQEDADAFAAALQKVIDNPENFIPNREQSIQIVKETYNWKHIAKTLFIALKEKGLNNLTDLKND